MTLVNSGTAAVLEMSCTPLALIGITLAFREEQFSWRRFSAIGVGVAGLSILFGPAALAGPSLAREQSSMRFLGGTPVITAAIAYGLGSVVARRLRMRCASFMPASVTAAVRKDLRASIGAQRRLIARWSCSTMLLRHRRLRTTTARHSGFSCRNNRKAL